MGTKPAKHNRAAKRAASDQTKSPTTTQPPLAVLQRDLQAAQEQLRKSLDRPTEACQAIREAIQAHPDFLAQKTADELAKRTLVITREDLTERLDGILHKIEQADTLCTVLARALEQEEFAETAGWYDVLGNHVWPCHRDAREAIESLKVVIKESGDVAKVKP